MPREIGQRLRRRPISRGTKGIFEMAREDATPYFGPVLRGTKGFVQFSQKNVTPLTPYSTLRTEKTYYIVLKELD